MALKEKIEKNRQEKHDEKYMKMALKEAKKAYDLNEVPIGCVIVHVFMDETRKFYDLERLWSDAESVDLSTIL